MAWRFSQLPKLILKKRGATIMAIKYFTDANSAAGYVSLQKENLTGITHVYHLNSPADTFVHELLEQLATLLTSRRISPEYIYNTFNPALLAGLIIRELDTAFISGKVVFEHATVIELNHVYDRSKIKENKHLLADLNQSMQMLYEKMYMHFNAALHIHDEWEKIYIDRIDFKKADTFRQTVLSKLFDGAQGRPREPIIVKRFFGASTPDGLTDFIPELTTGLTRYLVKGRPGTGKSTLMKAVVKKAMELGLDLDIYHCALDPKSLDMVVVPELSFCIFDATAPHEYEPSLKCDEVLDTYTAFIRKGTDERCAAVLKSVESKYNNQIKSAKAALKEASELRVEIGAIYKSAEISSRKEVIFAELIEKIKLTTKR